VVAACGTWCFGFQVVSGLRAAVAARKPDT
jgi:hypothetical protein